MSYRDNRYTPKVVDCMEIRKLLVGVNELVTRRRGTWFGPSVAHLCNLSTSYAATVLDTRRGRRDAR